MRYLLTIGTGVKKTAGSKAKDDIKKIFRNGESTLINITNDKNKVKKIILDRRVLIRNLKKIQDTDILYYQYPDYSDFLRNIFLKYTSKSKFKKVIILHDVESLRVKSKNQAFKKFEVDFFNKFDVIIAHNKHMKDWLAQNGIVSKIISLEIFDYLNSSKFVDSNNISIAYTGNLEKAKFLPIWNTKLNIALYGINPNKYLGNIKYKGSYTPEMLGDNISETFGLVWDGELLETCSGITGEYLRYNNPHKTSFYLSMGMPVIIWKQAALADFVEKNECGFTIDSLENLSEKMELLSIDEILIMKNKALELAKRIRKGYYTKRAIGKVEGLLEKEL